MNKTLLLIVLASTSCVQAEMHLHEALQNRYASLLHTEWYAYQLLKADPLESDVNFVAIPWADLVKHKDIKRAPKLKLDGGFTVCQHVYYKKILPYLVAMGVKVLFTPHAEKNEVYQGLVTVLPIAHYPANGVDPAENKDLLYSFIGLESHRIRTRIFRLPAHKDIVVIRRPEWNFYIQDLERREREQQEYKDVLSRSRFSLCAPGVGPGTPRFWESLKAGAIPVLFGDFMQLPEGFDWDSCVIRVPEKDIAKIYTILKNISQEQVARMREACYVAFDMFTGERFVDPIRRYYGEIE